MKIKQKLLRILPYLFIGLLATKLGQGWRLAEGVKASDKLLHLTDGISAAFQSPMPSFHLLDLCVGFLCGAGLWLAVYIKGRNAKKYRKGAEYGSARWGTAADIQPFVDSAFEQNVILTRTERLTMSSRPKNPANTRNKNVLVIGGSGSGKTRFFILPNLLQCHSSYVVTDPKGYNNIGQRKSHTVRRKSSAMWLFLYPI